jgi:phosphatidate cytidylyltransferase
LAAHLPRRGRPEVIAQRVMTALALVAALLVVLFVLPGKAATVILAAFFCVGAWEWSRLAGFEDPLPRVVFVAAAVLVGAWAANLARGGGLHLLAGMDVAVWLTALVWMLRYPVPVPRIFSTVSGLLVIPLGWLFLTTLLTGWGPLWVLFMFALVAAADVGAFFTGRAVGRNKLAPEVSPGKTWEGVAGGLALAALVGLGGALWFGLPPGTAVAAGAGIAAFSILGDLTVSMLKRHVGLKDTGRIFPGHGGVLDRIDSMLAAMPLFLVCYERISGG